MSYNPKDPSQNWLPDYVRQIADLFALKDWSFQIEASDPDGEMSVQCAKGRRRALMEVAESFWSLAPEKQRHCVTHELVHCHNWPAFTFAEERLGAMEKACLLEWEEYSTDSITDGVAPLMPLPPK